MNTGQIQEYADNAILIPTHLYELTSVKSLDGTQVFRVEHSEDV